ncbi:protein RETICULATA-RELATED 3, chloroplastic-like [Papaver somniferum]|uniref:protein RETICULATA-RELATED 3, chloroplastic-like n=1 Tax=Papaver somniferum TaxID=3469 RepID=UPI000E6FA8B3|nr:protein RETICULATA-RELATED 3, chloroplastic-like [Papaver somniferum]XP_026425417.1 protein RETICULATA-RELATED 3, chloroplastic-like [Papaver somniferum]XP_026425418.1 protein RETICULATA-RELATED 3, chloroplastic-like [Papaver somniferum]
MATTAQLRFSPLSKTQDVAAANIHSSNRTFSRSSLIRFPRPSNISINSRCPENLSLSLLQSKSSKHKFSVNAEISTDSGGNGGSGIGNRNTGGSGNNGGDSNSGGLNNDGDGDSENHSSSASNFGFLGFLLNGWRSRVAVDPQFPFKVLMEEIVGVSACVLGDMASRPNFGLNELDFVFSTLVVGSIMNFVLMYLLAPTMGTASSTLPAIFASCPTSHMFEPGMFSLLDRCGTFVYKGVVFAAVGFAAGLAGTAISNGLILMKKKMDPSFETPNKPPPTILNAMTWAGHMGFSSNLRYQTLNGIEYMLAKSLPPVGFKASVIVLRCLNNILGGVSFVALARLTGSQKTGESQVDIINEGEEDEETTLLVEKVKLVEEK